MIDAHDFKLFWECFILLKIEKVGKKLRRYINAFGAFPSIFWWTGWKKCLLECSKNWFLKLHERFNNFFLKRYLNLLNKLDLHVVFIVVVLCKSRMKNSWFETFTHTHTHTDTHTHIHPQIHRFTPTHTHRDTHTQIHTHAYIHI